MVMLILQQLNLIIIVEIIILIMLNLELVQFLVNSGFSHALSSPVSGQILGESLLTNFGLQGMTGADT